MSVNDPVALAEAARKPGKKRNFMTRQPGNPDLPSFAVTDPAQAKLVLSQGKSLCHPDKPHVAHGYCGTCYQKYRRLKDRKILPAKRSDSELDALVNFMAAKAELEKYGKRAKALLMENLPQYAEDHKRASQIAAEKGDAEPAQWALSTIKMLEGEVVVPPAPKTGTAGEGVKILIGVNLGGLPTNQPVTIDASPAPEPSARQGEPKAPSETSNG